MSTTAGNLVDETLDLLYGSTRPRINTLAAAFSDTTGTSITFTYDITGVTDGTLLSIDQELMHVVGTPNTSARTATVIRGVRGSTAATHSNGAQVLVNPKFNRFAVFRQLNHDLNDLSNQGLFQVKTVDLTFIGPQVGYDLTGVTSIYDILEVRYDIPGPSNQWPMIPPSQFRLQRSSETSDFASGFGIFLYRGGFPGMTVRVRYSAPMAQFTDETTTTTTVGLPDTAVDLPPLGAAMAVMIPREGIRDQYEAQPDTRRPAEVPPGALLGAARQWAAWRAARLNIELQNLHSSWPTVKR